MDNERLWIQAAQDVQEKVHELIKKRYNELRRANEPDPYTQRRSEKIFAYNHYNLARHRGKDKIASKIEAIKEVRQAYGLGLKNAKDLVEEMLSDNHITP